MSICFLLPSSTCVYFSQGSMVYICMPKTNQFTTSIAFHFLMSQSLLAGPIPYFGFDPGSGSPVIFSNVDCIG